jgi:hypothetical protein
MRITIVLVKLVFCHFFGFKMEQRHETSFNRALIKPSTTRGSRNIVTKIIKFFETALDLVLKVVYEQFTQASDLDGFFG